MAETVAGLLGLMALLVGGLGVLLDQLNPGHTDASGPDQPATADSRRETGRVDG